MKFGLYLSTHSRDIWRSQYIKCAYTSQATASNCTPNDKLMPCSDEMLPCSYKELKKILKQVLVAPYAVYVPTKVCKAPQRLLTKFLPIS